MNGDDVKRASAVAGIGAFVLTVLLLLAFAEPGRALLAALLSGLAVGLGVGLAGSVALLSRPVVRPSPRVSAMVGEPAEPLPPPDIGASLAAALGARPPAAKAPEGLPAGIPGMPPSGAATSPHDTSTLTVDDVVKAQDLHQTVRLDQPDMQYALAELTPEEILKEREGIDEAFLKAGIGLEEIPGASNNVGEGLPGTGGKT
ncbi:MAG: hypothetical protein AAB152_07480 [Candidatus Coatesbacteria bacterium]